jgi:EpsI family protein
MINSSLRFGLVVVVVLVGGLLVNGWAYLGEAHVSRNELKNFPQQVGSWKQAGSDQTIDEETLKVLRASDYVMRNYHNAAGEVANFYVGYYATQRDGATFHSPLNCLPGSGWTMSDPGRVTINAANGQSFIANRYQIQNGSERSLLIYWYQGRGRAVAGEYWGKVYTVLDSVRLRRSDGALVRVIVPIGDSESAALHSATDLAAGVTNVLPEFVPN